jgi:hypothetical protein
MPHHGSVFPRPTTSPERARPSSHARPSYSPPLPRLHSPLGGPHLSASLSHTRLGPLTGEPVASSSPTLAPRFSWARCHPLTRARALSVSLCYVGRHRQGRHPNQRAMDAAELPVSCESNRPGTHPAHIYDLLPPCASRSSSQDCRADLDSVHRWDCVWECERGRVVGVVFAGSPSFELRQVL